ncbi:MAG: hypothetical protein WC998_02765 [Candidatus Paceibacterota bacterium]|jgi:hypothetical protein
MSANHGVRKELHKKFGIALEKNSEILEQIKNLCVGLDLKGKTLEENTRLFSEELSMPYDYIARYVNRKISEEIKKRLKKIKGKKSDEICKDFCRNGKTFEKNISVLAEELKVPDEMMFLYAWHFNEKVIVAFRLYENDISCCNLFTGTAADRQAELEKISQEINMSPESIKKLLKDLK